MKVFPIQVYVLLMSLGAAVCLFLMDWAAFFALPRAALLGFAFLTLLGIASEALAFSSKADRQASTYSLTFIPLLAAVLLFGEIAAVIFIAVTGAVAEAVLRRKDWLKTIFNVAQWVVAGFLAGWTFVGLGGYPLATLGANAPFDPQIVPALAFGFVALLTNHVAVIIAVSLTQQAPVRKILWQAAGRVGSTVLYDIFVLPIAILVAFLYFALGWVGLLVSLLPLMVIRWTYLHKHRLETANRDLLNALVKAIETRDPYTSGHAVRVQDLAVRIGMELGLGARPLDDLSAAALLHDIGKIEVAYEKILKKPSALTPEERRIIESHVTRGVEILTSMSSLSHRVIEGVRHHHELFDGTGYPDGIAGTDIPMFGRIIKVSDAIDAMLSDRPYRKALSLEKVREELRLFSGKHFDPRLVDILRKTSILEEHEAQMRLAASLRSQEETSEGDSPSSKAASFL
jgi:putative nucleotidyltransferase with HDIG domain